MVKFQIVLDDKEWDALRELAEKEMRYPREEARYLLRWALILVGDFSWRQRGSEEKDVTQ